MRWSVFKIDVMATRREMLLEFVQHRQHLPMFLVWSGNEVARIAEEFLSIQVRLFGNKNKSYNVVTVISCCMRRAGGLHAVGLARERTYFMKSTKR